MVTGADTSNSCFIACLAVLPQFRKMGVAETLVREITRRYAQLGRSKIKVIVDPRDAVAVAVYEDWGFNWPTVAGQSCCCR